ncbi:DUF1043 family protein [Ectothiorhodospiraceae bacterium 2226]|nr:DUF1043 family protein [Ectothiorhodospiraceae bacterium 2226]
MSPLVWLLMLVLIAAAGAAGYYFGRTSSDQTRRVQRLEQDLEHAQADLARYQEEVTRHFGKTAHLFNNLTSTYRTLYEHLALGSHILTKGDTPRLEGEVPKGELAEEPLEADAERLPPEPWADGGREGMAPDEAEAVERPLESEAVGQEARDAAPPPPDTDEVAAPTSPAEEGEVPRPADAKPAEQSEESTRPSAAQRTP